MEIKKKRLKEKKRCAYCGRKAIWAVHISFSRIEGMLTIRCNRHWNNNLIPDDVFKDY